MNGDQLREMWRTGSTVRYHTVFEELIKTQTVGQHCFGVFWLVTALMRGEPTAPQLIAAMAHDSGERWAGDMPGPTKREIEMKPLLDDYEAHKLAVHTGFRAPFVNQFELAVVKLADALDGALFCCREIELGNRSPIVYRCLSNFGVYACEVMRSNKLGAHSEFNLPLWYELFDYVESSRKAFKA